MLVPKSEYFITNHHMDMQGKISQAPVHRVFQSCFSLQPACKLEAGQGLCLMCLVALAPIVLEVYTPSI